jgi:hypothetical protein
VAVVLPILVGAAAGSLDIPRNDDWSYRGIASRLFATGRFELDGAAEAAVLGQVLFTQPLLWLSGGAWPGFLAAGILSGVLTVVGGYLLVRRFLDRRSSTLAIGSLLIFPAYLAYAVSYMTDVPALACQFGCLGLAAVAVSRRPIGGRWLAAALVAGCLGFSIREFALAAPAAVIAVLFIREPGRPRTWLTIIATGLACLAILLSRFLLPGQLGDVPWEVKPIQALLPPLVSVSFVLSPVAFVAALRWRGIWHRRDVAVGLVLGGLAAISLIRIGIFPHVLQYDLITQWGAPSADYLIGQRPKLFPDGAWSMIGVLALAATVLVGGVTGGVAGVHIRRAARQPDRIRGRLGSPLGLLVFFVLAVTVGLGGFGLVGWLFDRYLWPVIPAVATLLLYVPVELRPSGVARQATDPAPANRNWRSLGLGAATALYVGVLATMAAALMFNSNAWDGARWRAAEALVDMGYSAESTDAGPEWVSSHQSGFAMVVNPVAGLTWWQKHWPSFELCAFVADSAASVDGQSLIRVEPDAYRLYLFLGPSEPFYLYSVANPGCPSLGDAPG